MSPSGFVFNSACPEPKFFSCNPNILTSGRSVGLKPAGAPTTADALKIHSHKKSNGRSGNERHAGTTAVRECDPSNRVSNEGLPSAS